MSRIIKNYSQHNNKATISTRQSGVIRRPVQVTMKRTGGLTYTQTLANSKLNNAIWGIRRVSSSGDDGTPVARDIVTTMQRSAYAAAGRMIDRSRHMLRPCVERYSQ